MYMNVLFRFPRREDVDAANSQQLANLSGPIYRYKANDTGRDKFQVEKLPQNCIAPTTLELKLNSQVMLLKNYENGLVNGSLGRVIDFKYDTDPSNNISGDITTKWPYVRFQNGREMLITPHAWTIEVPNEGEVARREQVPLLLAWAMSIHKSQGQTLERVIVDLRRVFEKGTTIINHS
jgi:ATP-dependent DNA helicase PIF1